MSPHQTAVKIVAENSGITEQQAADRWITRRIVEALQAASNAELERRRERVAGLEAALIAEGRCGTCDGTGVMGGTCDSCSERGYVSRDCGFCHGTNHWEAECAECDGKKHRYNSPLSEAALSGGTSALDAAIAEATRELREERDVALAELHIIRAAVGDDADGKTAHQIVHGLIAKVAEARDERDALRVKCDDEKSIRLKYQDAAYAACNALDLHLEERYTQADAESIKAAFQRLNEKRRIREESVRAEGKREGLEEARGIIEFVASDDFQVCDDEWSTAEPNHDDEREWVDVSSQARALLEKLAAQAGEAGNAD